MKRQHHTEHSRCKGEKREKERERKKHDENNNIKIKIIAKDEELKRTNVTRTSRRATWNADDSDTVAHRIIYTICNPLSLSVGDPSSRRLSHRSAFTRGHNSSTTTTPPPLSSCMFVLYEKKFRVPTDSTNWCSFINYLWHQQSFSKLAKKTQAKDFRWI